MDLPAGAQSTLALRDADLTSNRHMDTGTRTRWAFQDMGPQADKHDASLQRSMQAKKHVRAPRYTSIQALAGLHSYQALSSVSRFLRLSGASMVFPVDTAA